MTAKHNAHQVAARVMARGPAIEKALSDELDVQAQLVLRRMRQEEPKFQTTLTESTHVEKPKAMERLIAPGVDYAEAVHDGVKPGKGLPRYFDPESVDIVKWLESKTRGTGRRARKGSAKFTAAELDLRDRYMGLSWHVRHFGTKANPFVTRTHEAMAASVAAGLKAAAARALNDDGVGWRAS
ncbi:MAG: hypothetical protein V4451_04655 [Pseudomonadota bacterium]